LYDNSYQNAYKKASKQRLASEYRIPSEGTTTMQQQKYASTLTSESTYKHKGKIDFVHIQFVNI